MWKRLLLIVALAFSMTAQARHAATTLLDPPPLAIPAGDTALDVEKSILTCGIKRNWTVVDKQPGAIVLQYAAREFWVKVTVKYDSHAVSISYLDSSNLEYSKDNGVAMIHPNYNRWVNNLAHDIDGDLATRTAK
jgi:hypothetical protein